MRLLDQNEICELPHALFSLVLRTAGEVFLIAEFLMGTGQYLLYFIV
jgi:hypothetical protein